ncbi:MAG TPA: hypothetical protein VFA20_26340 [Myxococcaceae bacterium]|nr:hypothetical protein [Myxococcaceae bacterium]
MTASGAEVPWRFQFSGTLKGIYVMRYLMFSGGAGIALAVAQRAYDGRVGIGLAFGLLVGLFLFRGQLRPFRVPAMGLGREQLHFVLKKQDKALEWAKVTSVSAHDRYVALVLEGGGSMEILARDYGLSSQALATLLQGFLQPVRRNLLPPDAEVRRALGVA